MPAYKIAKTVPLPTRKEKEMRHIKRDHFAAAVERLQPGWSFVVPYVSDDKKARAKQQGALSAKLSYRKAKSGGKVRFTTRAEAKGFRIWRVL